jgi:hypothetical protein
VDADHRIRKDDQRQNKPQEGRNLLRWPDYRRCRNRGGDEMEKYDGREMMRDDYSLRLPGAKQPRTSSTHLPPIPNQLSLAALSALGALPKPRQLLNELVRLLCRHIERAPARRSFGYTNRAYNASRSAA